MRVLVCDDHRLFAECLATVLAARGHHVVTVRSPHDALGAIAAAVETAGDAATPVDVCVMDLMFPGGIDPFDAIGDIVMVSPDTRVIVLTACSPAFAEAQAIEAGAVDFLTKDGELSQIIDTVERSRGATRPVARHSGAVHLTAREREVLERLVRGERTRAIAGAMNVSYSTARSHVQSVLRKLGVHSRLEAVALASRHSLVPVDRYAG
jgi:DNA-binding NarL/FixJ family response regulator